MTVMMKATMTCAKVVNTNAKTTMTVKTGDKTGGMSRRNTNCVRNFREKNRHLLMETTSKKTGGNRHHSIHPHVTRLRCEAGPPEASRPELWQEPRGLSCVSSFSYSKKSKG